MTKKFMCPVCGFVGLKEPPYAKDKSSSFEICVCCGFEFGYDDASNTDVENKQRIYREKWIRKGANWFLPKYKPKAWQLNRQLQRLSKQFLNKGKKDV